MFNLSLILILMLKNFVNTGPGRTSWFPSGYSVTSHSKTTWTRASVPMRMMCIMY